MKYGNLALKRSCDIREPVRVVRGPMLESVHAPESGFRYDGLYQVLAYWREPGRSGKLIWRFLLSRDAAPSDAQLEESHETSG